MNVWFGGPFGQEYQNIYRLSQIKNPPPSKLFVFIDTHEDSISVGSFNVPPAGTDVWEHLPAWRHAGKGALVFADGHSEQKKWLDKRTVLPVTRTSKFGLRQPGNPDIFWLQERATWKKPY